MWLTSNPIGVRKGLIIYRQRTIRGLSPELSCQHYWYVILFCKAFYVEPDQPDVEKEITNNDNTGESDGVIRPTEPHCWYRVVNDTCDENDTQLFPGIFMEISGDFREAFDNNGLSLYISFADDPSTSYKAISASTMEKLMETVVLDAQAERIENHLQNNTQEEEDNNPAE